MASNGSLEAGVPLEAVAKQQGYCRAVYWFSIVLSTIYGGIWIYAGGLKARDPFLFLIDIRSFQMLGDPYAAYLALCLPWLEIVCGLCVILRKLYLGALTILTGLLAIFLVAIFSAKQRGLDITCGCFGKSENETDYAEIISRDIILLVFSFALIGASLWLGSMASKSRNQEVQKTSSP